MDKNTNKEEIFNNPIAILLFIILIGVGGYFLFNTKNSDNTKVNEISGNTQQEQIDVLKKELEDLKNQKPQTIVKEVEKPSSKPNLTTIINQWRPRIAYIECSWWGASGVVSEGAGSGVLGPKASDGAYFILTNKHVVSNEKSNPATQCNIWLPSMSSPYTVTADLERMVMNDVSFDPVYDYGNIIISRPTQQIISVANNSKYTTCEGRASAGEQVLILGYPGIGSSNDITVTDGIISGYENGYYITSAKIEHGNSGGAAILVEKNCYLGIPSFAYSGEIESLARILDMSSASPVWSANR